MTVQWITPFVADSDDCVPSYGNYFAAGLDLRAGKDMLLPFGVPTSAGTGLRIAIPHDHVGLVRGRSGMAFRRGIWSFEGTIDEDYRGEIGLLLLYAKRHEDQELTGMAVVKKGERVAQLIVVPCIRLRPERVTQLPKVDGGRGERGFGSTGE